MVKHVNAVYEKYLKSEWSKPYQCAGVYSITINNKLVYIGKSKNILYRMTEHWCSITNPTNNKYRVLSEARKRNYKIQFHVIYPAKKQTEEEIENEIGHIEGFCIRETKPPLNYQIPKEENWRQFTVNNNARTITLDQIMEEENYE